MSKSYHSLCTKSNLTHELNQSVLYVACRYSNFSAISAHKSSNESFYYLLLYWVIGSRFSFENMLVLVTYCLPELSMSNSSFVSFWQGTSVQRRKSQHLSYCLKYIFKEHYFCHNKTTRAMRNTWNGGMHGVVYHKQPCKCCNNFDILTEIEQVYHIPSWTQQVWNVFTLTHYMFFNRAKNLLCLP